MGGDMSDGAKIAITLIILGVLISIIFTILSFTRSATNQGVSSVQSSMSAMELSRFDDYDQAMISGTQVKAALKLFEGQPIATVVRTMSQMDSAANTGNNYGALLEGTNTSTFVTAALAKTGTNSFYEYSINMSTGSMQWNMNYIATSKSGTNAYIRPTAKFLAELIKDSTGTIVGVCFTQQ